MIITKRLVASVLYKQSYTFPTEVWLEFKDTVRDDSDFPDHDEDIRFEYGDDFYDWLEERFLNGDTRISIEEKENMLDGEYQALEWTD